MYLTCLCGTQHLVCFPKVPVCCKPYILTFLRCRVTSNYLEVSVQPYSVLCARTSYETHCLTVQPVVLNAVSQRELGKDSESVTHTRTAAPTLHNGGTEEQRNVDHFSANALPPYVPLASCVIRNGLQWLKPVRIFNWPSACLHELETHMQILFILPCN